MADWETHISQDTLDWLLEETNPSVRYFTLINILNKKDDKDVAEAKKHIMEKGPVKKILSRQRPDGSFLTDAIIKRYGQIAAKSGYLPKYKGTIWQPIFLTQLGADRDDERIKKLCKFILGTNYSKEHQTLGTYTQRKGDIHFVTMPCYIANMVWSLSKLGFYKDERVRNSIKWLLKYQRFDDGDFKTPNTWPYRGSKDRCFGRHSCYIGCTQALKAMAVIPKRDRNKDVEKFINKAIDFVLLHKVYKKSRVKDEPIKKMYELLTFPLTYYDDILQILETLLFFKVRDKAIDDVIKFILSKKNDNGRWCLEGTASSSSMYGKLGEKGEESKWITYRVINLLKKYYETYAA